MTGPVRIATVITRLESGSGQMAVRGAAPLSPGRFRTTIVTGSASAGGGDRLAAEAAAAGIDVVVEPLLRRPIRPGTDRRALAALTRLLADREFDVVHTHCAKAGVLGRIAARRAGVPRVVHTYHGLPFHPYQPWPVRAAYERIERRLGEHTDLALCVGDAVAAEVARLDLLRPERIRAIPVVATGSDQGSGPVGDRAAARAAARTRLGLSADAVVVGTVGRLAYQKAPEDFVAAIRRLNRPGGPGVVGVWVGDGELAAATRRRARGSGIVFTGERPDVTALLPAFDVFVLGSRYEGLPIALVEAMAAGVPVVATAVNAVPDVVRSNETGILVPPSRPDVLAGAVGHLLERPDHAARLAAAGRDSVLGRFTAARLAECLAAAYCPIAAPIIDRIPYVKGQKVVNFGKR